MNWLKSWSSVLFLALAIGVILSLGSAGRAVMLSKSSAIGDMTFDDRGLEVFDYARDSVWWVERLAISGILICGVFTVRKWRAWLTNIVASVFFLGSLAAASWYLDAIVSGVASVLVKDGKLLIPDIANVRFSSIHHLAWVLFYCGCFCSLWVMFDDKSEQ